MYADVVNVILRRVTFLTEQEIEDSVHCCPGEQKAASWQIEGLVGCLIR